MRYWTACPSPTLCGRCGRSILRGEPMQTIELHRAHLRRCETCAEGQAPPDLPDRLVTETGRVVPKWAALLPFKPRDEREPGEEG